MKTILLVDDNEILIDALASWLSRQMPDCRILIGFNGREGVEILKQYPVDLVLTDLNMPIMNGYMFIEQKNTICPSVPLIAMTSYRSDEVITRLKILGVTQCLEKPFEFASMAGRFMEAMQADRSHCEAVPA